jgi:hypothetical protein
MPIIKLNTISVLYGFYLLVLLFAIPNVFASQCIYVINAQCPLNDSRQVNTEFIFLFSSKSIANNKNKVCRSKVSVNKAATMYLKDTAVIRSFCMDEDGYHFSNFINIKSTDLFIPSIESNNVDIAIKKGHFLVDYCLDMNNSAKCISNIIDGEFKIKNIDSYLIEIY